MDKIYIGVTDDNWFSFIKYNQLTEVNFWKPGSTNFKALNSGDLFLFKTHNPIDKIVGGGTFKAFVRLPISSAWERFGVQNGVGSLYELQSKLTSYRSKNYMSVNDPEIGCILLENVFYLKPTEMISVPDNFNKYTVQGKLYSQNDPYYDKLKDLK